MWRVGKDINDAHAPSGKLALEAAPFAPDLVG
jgi:hypothetical protein